MEVKEKLMFFPKIFENFQWNWNFFFWRTHSLHKLTISIEKKNIPNYVQYSVRHLIITFKCDQCFERDSKIICVEPGFID